MSEGIITRRIKTPTPLLLDSFPNSAAAYSLRSLKLSGRNKPVVKVRRDSDNAEQDFSSAEINDGSLLTFVGNASSDNGFVTTWYDQSGNGNDATQSTAGSQPKIVDAGSLVVENGKPAIDFDGSNDFFSASSWGISGTQDRSFFITAKANENSIDKAYVGIGDGTTATNTDKWFISTETAIRVFGGNEVYGSPSTSQALVSHIFSGTNVTDNTAYINGTESVATSSNPTTISTDDTVNLIGRPGSGSLDFFDGKYQELLIYDSDQSSNRQQIESNINNHYGIY